MIPTEIRTGADFLMLQEPSANVKQEFAGKLTGHSLSDLPEQHSAQHMGLHSLQSSGVFVVLQSVWS